MIRSTVLSVVLSVSATQLWCATVGDPDRPGIMSPDSRLIGNRDSVSLVRWQDTPGDEEPLYIVSEYGREKGFAREGDQCYSAKLGGEIVPCEGSVAKAIETAQAIGAGPSYGVTLSDWPVPPLFPIPGGETVYVVPVEPVQSVPTPTTAILLLGALASIVATGVRR